MERLVQSDINLGVHYWKRLLIMQTKGNIIVQRVSQTDSENSNHSYSSGSGQDIDLDIEHQYNSGNENLEEEEPVVDKL